VAGNGVLPLFGAGRRRLAMRITCQSQQRGYAAPATTKHAQSATDLSAPHHHCLSPLSSYTVQSRHCSFRIIMTRQCWHHLHTKLQS